MPNRIPNIPNLCLEQLVISFTDVPKTMSLSIYLRGCPFKCAGCQNCQLQDIEDTKYISVENITAEIRSGIKNYTKWVSILGGEPLFQFKNIVRLFNYLYEYNLYLYTGFDTIACFTQFNLYLFNNIKVIKTGRYLKEYEKTGNYPITTNQHVLIRLNDNGVIRALRPYESREGGGEVGGTPLCYCFVVLGRDNYKCAMNTIIEQKTKYINTINTTSNLSLNCVIADTTIIVENVVIDTYLFITANTELVEYLCSVAKVGYILLQSSPETYDKVYNIINKF